MKRLLTGKRFSYVDIVVMSAVIGCLRWWIG